MVIVSYRCRELLRACLDSLRANPPACPDERRGGGQRLRGRDSGDGGVRPTREVELIASPTNLGFAAATNLGAEARARPVPAGPQPRHGSHRGRARHGDRGARVRSRRGRGGTAADPEDGTLDHAAKRSFPTPLSALGHFTGVGRRPGARGKLAAYRAPEVESGRGRRRQRGIHADAALEPSMGWAASTRATGCTWRTSTSPTGSPGGLDQPGTSRHRDGPSTSRGAATGGRTVGAAQLGLPPGNVPLLSKHYAAERSRALNALVYVGIARQVRRDGGSVASAPDPRPAAPPPPQRRRQRRRVRKRPVRRVGLARARSARSPRTLPLTPPRFRSTTCLAGALTRTSLATTPADAGSHHPPFAQQIAAPVAHQVVLSLRPGTEGGRVLVQPASLLASRQDSASRSAETRSTSSR